MATKLTSTVGKRSFMLGFGLSRTAGPLVVRHNGGLSQSDLPLAILKDPEVGEAPSHGSARQGMACPWLVDLLAHQDDFAVAAGCGIFNRPDKAAISEHA